MPKKAEHFFPTVVLDRVERVQHSAKHSNKPQVDLVVVVVLAQLLLDDTVEARRADTWYALLGVNLEENTALVAFCIFTSALAVLEAACRAKQALVNLFAARRVVPAVRLASPTKPVLDDVSVAPLDRPRHHVFAVMINQLGGDKWSQKLLAVRWVVEPRVLVMRDQMRVVSWVHLVVRQE